MSESTTKHSSSSTSTKEQPHIKLQGSIRGPVLIADYIESRVAAMLDDDVNEGAR
jgi:hypothetical protein